MNPEPYAGRLFFGNERRTFVRIPVMAQELDLLPQQDFTASCQEIADLYSMLRHKCTQDELLLEFDRNPAVTAQTH